MYPFGHPCEAQSDLLLLQQQQQQQQMPSLLHTLPVRPSQRCCSLVKWNRNSVQLQLLSSSQELTAAMNKGHCVDVSYATNTGSNLKQRQSLYYRSFNVIVNYIEKDGWRTRHIADRLSSEAQRCVEFSWTEKDSSVSTVTTPRAARPWNRGRISGSKVHLSLPTAARQTLETTQPLIQYLPGDPFSGAKQQ